MNVWLIGGGIYFVLVSFALALCRVAAPTNQDDIHTRACATKPTIDTAEYEQLVGQDGDHADTAIRSEEYNDPSHEVPASRPSVRSQRPRDLGRDSRWPQPSPAADISPAPRSLHPS